MWFVILYVVGIPVFAVWVYYVMFRKWASEVPEHVLKEYRADLYYARQKYSAVSDWHDLWVFFMILWPVLLPVWLLWFYASSSLDVVAKWALPKPPPPPYSKLFKEANDYRSLPEEVDESKETGS